MFLTAGRGQFWLKITRLGFLSLIHLLTLYSWIYNHPVEVQYLGGILDDVKCQLQPAVICAVGSCVAISVEALDRKHMSRSILAERCPYCCWFCPGRIRTGEIYLSPRVLRG